MKVREVMHAPAITAARDTTLHDAARRMVTSDVGTLVVIDDGRPVGMLTDRDLAVRGYAGSLAPTVAIEKVMTSAVRFVHPDDDVFDAVHVMAASGIRRLAVVDDDHQVLGVVAFDDVAMLLSKELADLTTTVRLQATHELADWGSGDVV